MNASSAMVQSIGSSPYRAGLAHNGQVDRARAAREERYGDLMRAAQRGDRAAYSALLHGILPLLRQLVRSRLRFLQAADHEDLVQEILLSVHAARASYDPSRPFMPWLMCIAHHRMVDGARRCGRRNAREQLVDDFADAVAEPPASSQPTTAIQRRCAARSAGSRRASAPRSSSSSCASCPCTKPPR